MADFINYDDYYKTSIKPHNSDWPYTPDLLFRTIIVGGSGTGKTNMLFNLIRRLMANNDTFIDKVYLYVKDPEEPKYKHFIKNRKEIGESETGDPNMFVEVSSSLDDVHNDINQYNPDRLSNVLIVFDDMICEVIPPKVSELFIRGRKLNISLVFITQSYYAVPKDIRLNCTHYHILSIPKRKEVRNIADDCAVSVGFDEFMKLFKECTKKRFDCLTIDCTLDGDDINRLRHNFTGKILTDNSYNSKDETVQVGDT